ncbi:MAG TPA: aspartate/glutamate racemase family protein [Alphaproteobacteria bacterium]|nr:aspartate/glutamate racemase family protein [Alphaproteobacteria bacterium]
MPGPRIALIHALPESPEPANRAFAALWPEAARFNLMDDSLAPDLAAAGSITPAINQRFLDLAHYAARAGARGILFTCSAFGQAIDACKAALGRSADPIPVLKPNEAALEAALRAGPRIALLATFGPTIPSMTAELEAMAKAKGVVPTILTRVVDGALAALKRGDAAEHDRLIARAAADLIAVDALVLTQFSMARAASAIAPADRRTVITTPESAILKLRELLQR